MWAYNCQYQLGFALDIVSWAYFKVSSIYWSHQETLLSLMLCVDSLYLSIPTRDISQDPNTHCWPPCSNSGNKAVIYYSDYLGMLKSWNYTSIFRLVGSAFRYTTRRRLEEAEPLHIYPSQQKVSYRVLHFAIQYNCTHQFFFTLFSYI